jgi:hypothetical protein
MNESEADKLAWERLPEESGPAWAAFGVYRDCGPRRTRDGAYRAVVGIEGASKGPRAPRAWKRWSKEHRWEDRARAYDAHLESIAATATEDEVKIAAAARQRAIETHKIKEASLASALIDRALAVLRDPKARVTVGDAVRAAEAAVRIGRLNLGLSTQSVGPEFDDEYIADEEAALVYR